MAYQIGLLRYVAIIHAHHTGLFNTPIRHFSIQSIYSKVSAIRCTIIHTIQLESPI